MYYTSQAQLKLSMGLCQSSESVCAPTETVEKPAVKRETVDDAKVTTDGTTEFIIDDTSDSTNDDIADRTDDGTTDGATEFTIDNISDSTTDVITDRTDDGVTDEITKITTVDDAKDVSETKDENDGITNGTTDSINDGTTESTINDGNIGQYQL